MRGRQPKSRLLKVMMGTARPDRLNYREPVAAPNLAEPPEWLTASQRAEWAFVVANAPPGMLKQLDRTILAAWICAADTFRLAAVQLAKQRNPFGKRAAHCLALQARQVRLLKTLAVELGFSPAARPRIAVAPEPGAEASEFEKLMG